MLLEVARVPSPLGPLTVVVGAGGLRALEFDTGGSPALGGPTRRSGGPTAEWRESDDPGGVVRRLRAYFEGDLLALDAIAVDPEGTPFQRRVWEELRRIPPGRTMSYGALARAIGRPAAVRAVGAANGRNPIAIVVPCHRVIGTDGGLTGYGGELWRKEW